MASIGDLLARTTNEAREFTFSFFRFLDGKEDQKCLVPETTVVWNGSPLAGPDAIAQMFKACPDFKHTVTSLNAHPLPNCTPTSVNMVISAGGNVHVDPRGTNSMLGYSATFVVQKAGDNAPFVLQTMNYRFVHKPATYSY